MSFKVAPGVRIRASSRGVSASSSVGRPTVRARPRPHGTTKASIAAYERELKAAQREADIEKVAALEKALVSVHTQAFPKAERADLPPIDPVDPAPMEGELEADAGIPGLLAKLDGKEAPPVASAPEPVDRYELMREHRKCERRGIAIWRLREQIEAARRADTQAETAGDDEEVRRREAQAAEQARLDELWAELQSARSKVADRLVLKTRAEKERREAEREAEQAELDQGWEMLQANHPEPTMSALEQAFADNEAPAAPLDCEGDRVTVLMQFQAPEEIAPERKPTRTPTGKRTLKKRTKTEINSFYVEALSSNVLATVKETFAVAPGTQVVQMLVVRREIDKKHTGELAAIYIGGFDRGSQEGASGSRDPSKALTLATESELNLKGKTEQVAPLDLSERPDLQAVLTQVAEELGT